MASVTVFVDDAVRGRFPPVCAYTGAETRRLARVDARVGGPSGWVWLLLLGGPPGWALLVLILVCFDGIDVDLDASRRWVTIRGVHHRFAAATADHPVRTDR